MKRLSLAMIAVLFSVTVSFAAGNSSKLSKEPFAVSFERLSKYLELAPYQMNEVADINDYFIEKQNESIRSTAKRQEKKMEQAVYSNLKLMKDVLTPEQYRKYLVLLNVTNNNNRAQGINALPDMFLADADQK